MNPRSVSSAIDEMAAKKSEFFVIRKVGEGRALFLNIEFGWGPYGLNSAHFLTRSLAERAARNFSNARVDTVEA